MANDRHVRQNYMKHNQEPSIYSIGDRFCWVDLSISHFHSHLKQHETQNPNSCLTTITSLLIVIFPFWLACFNWGYIIQVLFTWEIISNISNSILIYICNVMRRQGHWKMSEVQQLAKINIRYYVMLSKGSIPNAALRIHAT